MTEPGQSGVAAPATPLLLAELARAARIGRSAPPAAIVPRVHPDFVGDDPVDPAHVIRIEVRQHEGVQARDALAAEEARDLVSPAVESRIDEQAAPVRGPRTRQRPPWRRRRRRRSDLAVHFSVPGLAATGDVRGGTTEPLLLGGAAGTGAATRRPSARAARSGRIASA
jgi:hypothetical protein